jgi:hypothetical protein
MKRRVGKAEDLVVPLAIGAVIIGGAWLLLNKLGNILPSSAQGANNQGTTDANTQAAAASASQTAAQGVSATLTPNQMAGIANDVNNLGIAASGPNDLGSINSTLDQVNNIADLNGVIAAFGTKKIPAGDITAWYNTCLSLGINCTAVGLGAFIQAVYAAYDSTGNYLNTLNNYLYDQGINYQF